MDYLLPLFQFAYFVAHFLFSLCQAVYDCFQEVKQIILNTLWWKSRFTPSQAKLLADTSQLKKIPRHLGLIFQPNNTNDPRHICYVISWAEGVGIHHITLYDVNGILKQKLPSILACLRSIKSESVFSVFVDDQVYNKESANHLDNGPVNHKAAFSRNKISVNILSYEDGRNDIVKAAQKIKPNEAKDLLLIHERLITKTQPDPDLAFIIGGPLCTYGFLPWHIRLTEFLAVPSLSRLDYPEFANLLREYSKCEQRLGR